MSIQPFNPDEYNPLPIPTQDDSSNEVRDTESPDAEQLSRLELVYSSHDSETETEMSDRRQDKYRESSKNSSSKSSSKSGSKSSSASGSKSSSKSSKSKKDDWSDVVEPDERRRIQNRIGMF